MAYNYLNQNVVASLDLQPHDDDSFYNPTTNSHTGFAADGTRYTLGVQDAGPVYASWYTEYPNAYRGDQAQFPTYGLVLLSFISLTILDQAVAVSQASQLPLWMVFILGDSNALTNNYNGSPQGFLPSGLTYADGVVSVIYMPDSGNQPPAEAGSPPSPLPTDSAQSSMVVSIDFVRDQVYLDVAL